MRPLHLPLLVKIRHACSFVSSEESNWVQSARIESLVRSSAEAEVAVQPSVCPAGRLLASQATAWAGVGRGRESGEGQLPEPA